MGRTSGPYETPWYTMDGFPLGFPVGSRDKGKTMSITDGSYAITSTYLSIIMITGGLEVVGLKQNPG